MQALQLTDIADYATLLANTATEFDFLIDDVTVPETWFFRDGAPFEALKKFALEYLVQTPGNDKLNILSIPSSTGEEPYSIAMCLSELGIPGERFSIHALDICTRSLQAASRGIYTHNSFRGQQSADIIRKYFSVEGSRYILSPYIKDMVSFARGNIVDPNLVLPLSCYQVIFCRNLLIYFDAHNKKLAYERLHTLLDDDGRMFIGHSESGAVPQELFTHTGIPNSFSYTRARHEPRQANHSSANGRRPPAGHHGVPGKPATARTRGDTARTHRVRRPLSRDTAERDAARPDLRLAQSLADSGQVAAAQAICNEYLRLDNKNPQAYFLLGLTSLADNNQAAAESNLRKAIYLDPGHYEALSHLALLLEQTGDTQAAVLLRKRAQRAASRAS